MPNNIGAFDQANPLFDTWSVRWIDADGQLTSDDFVTKPVFTNAEMDAFLDGVGGASNASAYQIVRTSTWGALPSAANALNAAHVSVKDQIIMLFKSLADQQTQVIYMPAPDQGNFDAGTDTPNPTLPNLSGAINGAIGVLPGNYGLVSVRFTQERKINARVRV